jgi:hypothetical protein
MQTSNESTSFYGVKHNHNFMFLCLALHFNLDSSNKKWVEGQVNEILAHSKCFNHFRSSIESQFKCPVI